MKELALVAALVSVPFQMVRAGDVAVGYMLDISRDKVPTMRSLHRIVNVLQAIGYNQFQLYTEHTFAYTNHVAVWGDASPMTAAEIRELDAYCAARGIELVPNQNSFGHLEKWLHKPEYKHLAEHPEPLSTNNGLLPRALCPTDPQSVAFLASLYDELLPNFRSRLFNVGCDEIWDLAHHGRSDAVIREKGKEEVWFDFFGQICALAKARGHRVMFWNDMVFRSHPEQLSRLPEDVIALEWGYGVPKDGGPDVERDKRVKAMKATGRAFYLCPGTGGWNSISGRHEMMRGNVRNLTDIGRRHGAAGYLMTDWGNGGMCQPWMTALPALVDMRARIDGRDLTDDELAAEIDRLVGTRCGSAIIRFGRLYLLSGQPMTGYASTIYRMLSRGKAYQRPKAVTEASMSALFEERHAINRSLDLTAAPDWIRDGFATLNLLYDALELRWKGEHERVTSEFPSRYRDLWLRHNRMGGLEDSVSQNFSVSRSK